MAVVFTFAYSAVNSLFLLAGLAIILSSKRLVRVVDSSSHLLLLARPVCPFVCVSDALLLQVS